MLHALELHFGEDIEAHRLLFGLAHILTSLSHQSLLTILALYVAIDIAVEEEMHDKIDGAG